MWSPAPLLFQAAQGTVGSTTVADVAERYQRAHGLQLCARSKSLMNSTCDVINTHAGSEGFVGQYGLEQWLNIIGRPALPKAISAIIIREPADRLLSRFFTDKYAEKKNIRWQLDRGFALAKSAGALKYPALLHGAVWHKQMRRRSLTCVLADCSQKHHVLV